MLVLVLAGFLVTAPPPTLLDRTFEPPVAEGKKTVKRPSEARVR
ncbi:MAG: hypothetical protein ACRC1K_25240 [Planctomycetia bacterium]